MFIRRRAFIQLLFSLPLAAGIAKRVGAATGWTRFLLNRFHVAGFQYYSGPALLKGIRQGEELTITVQTEGLEDEHLFERSYTGLAIPLPVLKPGSLLSLVREPGNPYDSFAVEIFCEDIKLGYVPRTDNIHISRLLQQGAHVICRAVEVDPHTAPWEMVKVEVLLEI